MSDDGQKAVDLGPRAVQALWERDKQPLLDKMDFRGFPQQHGFDLIDKIYPKNAKFGKLDPTDEFLASGAGIKVWRKIGKSDQQYKIDKAAEATVVTEGQSGKRRRRGSSRGAAVYEAATADDFQLNHLGGQNMESPPRRRSSRRNIPVPETPRRPVDLQLEQLSNQMSSSQMIHDDDNVDSMPELEQIQILPSQPRDLDDVETSMADDAVEALSSGACDSSALELLADVATMPSCSSRGVGRAPVSMSALGAISIGVSVQTIEESKLDDKEILIDGFWHAQGVATRLKSTYRSNYRGLWPFPDYVTGVLIDPRHVGEVLSQVEENYIWALFVSTLECRRVTRHSSTAVIWR